MTKTCEECNEQVDICDRCGEYIHDLDAMGFMEEDEICEGCFIKALKTGETGVFITNGLTGGSDEKTK